MIKISVDEAVAFDMLAILECKCKHKPNDGLKQSAELLFDDLVDQISYEKLEEVLNSIEFKNLVTINDRIFDLVDLAKQNKVTPKEVDDANYQRYLAKKCLQNNLFNNEISEQKIGYN